MDTKTEIPEHKRTPCSHGRRSYSACVRCIGSEAIARKMKERAKKRARIKGLPFNIGIDEIYDLIVDTRGVCPVLGIVLKPLTGKINSASPTLDRKIDSLGYVSGNCAVISLKANTMKSNGTAEELQKVLDYVKKIEAEHK